MKILPHKLATTKDPLTSVCSQLAQFIDSLQLSEHIDPHFPLPKSNRGDRLLKYIESLMLMQHEGGHLDDVRHLIHRNGEPSQR